MKKTFSPTKEMIDAATAVFEAMALVKTIEPIVKKYERDILAKHQFSIDPKWVALGCEDVIILDPENSHELRDEDFVVYDTECRAARDAAGLKVENDEYCPLLVAKHILIDAKRVLADTMKPITGLGADDVICSNNGMENYKEYIDLTLKLLAPYVNVKKAA